VAKQAMIKAVIFDCFGVLVGEGWKPFRNEHFGKSGPEHDWANEQMSAVSRGEMTHEEIARLMHEKTGVSAKDFLTVLHTNPANEALLEYIEQLKPQYKIGFLSNVGMNRLEELFTPHQLSLFDEMTLSYNLGVAKPDPKAYIYTADQLGIKPDECLFVDDTYNYCEGAKAVGMTAILYKNFDQFKVDMDQYV
jgi:epoxide hydrolase-like predicted phosphatase